MREWLPHWDAHFVRVMSAAAKARGVAGTSALRARALRKDRFIRRGRRCKERLIELWNKREQMNRFGFRPNIYLWASPIRLIENRLLAMAQSSSPFFR